MTKIQGKTTKLKSILASERNEMTYEDVEKFMKFNNMSMDIVTVRHRPKLETISLSKAIDLLWTKGYEYSDIHCCFCRNTFLSSIKS